jgi:hypothetical protein
MVSAKSGEDCGISYPNPFKRDSWWRIGIDVLTQHDHVTINAK